MNNGVFHSGPSRSGKLKSMKKAFESRQKMTLEVGSRFTKTGTATAEVTGKSGRHYVNYLLLRIFYFITGLAGLSGAVLIIVWVVKNGILNGLMMLLTYLMASVCLLIMFSGFYRIYNLPDSGEKTDAGVHESASLADRRIV